MGLNHGEYGDAQKRMGGEGVGWGGEGKLLTEQYHLGRVWLWFS